MAWPVVAAYAASAIASVAGSVFGGKAAAGGAEDAAAIAQQAGFTNNALNRTTFAQGYKDLGPYRDAGYNALDQMLALQGLAPVNRNGAGQLDPTLSSATGVPANARPLSVDGIPVQFGVPGQPGTASQRSPAYVDDQGRIYADGIGFVGQAVPGQDVPGLVRGKDNTVAVDAQGRFTDSGSKVQNRVFGPSFDPNQTSVTAGQGINEGTGEFIGGSAFNPEQAQQNALSTFRNTPGYAFAQQEGANALDKSAAGRGGLLSGATIRAQARYASGLADQTYGAYYDRLSNLAGLGGTAVGAGNQAGQFNAGQQQSSNLTVASGVGNALATAANSRASAIQNVGNTVSDVFGTIAGAYGGGTQGIDWGSAASSGKTIGNTWQGKT